MVSVRCLRSSYSLTPLNLHVDCLHMLLLDDGCLKLYLLQVQYVPTWICAVSFQEWAPKPQMIGKSTNSDPNLCAPPYFHCRQTSLALRHGRRSLVLHDTIRLPEKMRGCGAGSVQLKMQNQETIDFGASSRNLMEPSAPTNKKLIITDHV